MAENTETQAAAIEELLATATTVADQVKENRDNSAMAEETSVTSEEPAAQSVTLNELVKRFKLN